MENNTNLINKLNKMLDKEDFIFQPFDYLHDNMEEVFKTDVDLDCLALIINHNKDIIERNAEIHNKFCDIIDAAQDINDIQEDNESEENNIENDSQNDNLRFVDYDSYIDILYFAQENKNLEEQIEKLTSQQIPLNSLKYSIYKKIKKIELQIRNAITYNVLKDISSYQNEITKLKSLLEALTIKNNQEQDIKSKDPKYNVIFIPNSKNQLYIYDDITKYLNSAKEIKIALDKIYSGYIIESKNMKSLEKNEKLYEYKTPTGLRIMFVINGNNIFVSLLFYKDKQRSTKVNNLYDEAIKRYQSNEELLLSNLNNPNFYLEQAELLGNLYTLLEDRTLKLSKGE